MWCVWCVFGVQGPRLLVAGMDGTGLGALRKAGGTRYLGICSIIGPAGSPGKVPDLRDLS